MSRDIRCPVAVREEEEDPITTVAQLQAHILQRHVLQETTSPLRRRTAGKSRKRRKGHHQGLYLACAAFAVVCPQVLAQSCISLSQSTQCSSFNGSSISTDSALTGLFPFLSSVTDAASFDSGIQQYISTNFTQQRYQQLIGCSNVDLSNTTDYYARYTTSVLCNAIIQNSITPCGLTGSATTPLCADTCSEYAQSEEEITASNLCGTAGPNALSQIRADFTNCALPADSLSGTCIQGSSNEPDNCGYSTNLGGLCSYCAASSPNATDSCCVFSKTETRCSGVVLAITATSSLQPLFTSTSTSSATPSSSTSSGATTNAGHVPGLSGGQIAGIVVGSILGAFLLLALLILGCVLLRRRKQSSPASSVFNQPGQLRQGPPMAMHDGAGFAAREPLEALPGGRVARMAALEGGDSSDDRQEAVKAPSTKYARSSSEQDMPGSLRALGSAPPKRSGSLTSGSILAIGGTDDSSSPEGALSSPEGTGQSEQLDFFKDYYSQDEIHVSDLVSTLWAYEPRANDEHELERGDMLKVTGIWDDGWATGVLVRKKAEDWRGASQTQRDSGMSNGSSGQTSPEVDSDIKAFPLVCVCLPQHWQKTIEGDTTEEFGTSEVPRSP